jgi:hypothetical protein
MVVISISPHLNVINRQINQVQQTWTELNKTKNDVLGLTNTDMTGNSADQTETQSNDSYEDYQRVPTPSAQTNKFKLVTPNAEFVLDVEIADEPDERSKGLMYREDLCDNCGMLFVYDSDHISGFWMKNCEIPLDLIFFDESGDVIAIKRNFEPCHEDTCPSFAPNEPYRYVLEVNGGWTEVNDVNESASADLLYSSANF